MENEVVWLLWVVGQSVIYWTQGTSSRITCVICSVRPGDRPIMRNPRKTGKKYADQAQNWSKNKSSKDSENKENGQQIPLISQVFVTSKILFRAKYL